METEAISIDTYLACDDSKKFDFLYENFSVLRPTIDNYREELISDVKEMKAYNHRAAIGDLGVRVQISIGHSSPTEREAYSNMAIEEAVDSGVLDDVSLRILMIRMTL